MPISVSSASLPDFSELVENAAPAVVKINTVSSPERNQNRDSRQGQLPEIFRDLLNRNQRPARPSRTMGSGFVIDQDGFILTNHHVVDGAEEIQVQFSDRSEFSAVIVGSDRRSDLALLKIEAENLPSLQFAESDSIKVGSWVLAIGSPFGLDYSVTAGIVSAIGRSLPTERGENYVPFIQTDVAINRGNSGGPLFNLEGEVVGINSQIYSPTGGSVGLSFSIPVSIAENVVSQLRSTGKVTRGYFGVAITDVNKDLALALGLPGPMGAAVSNVNSNSAAEKGGILDGDIIVEVDNQAILRSGDLPHIVGLIAPGTEVPVEVYRKGKVKKLLVTVGALDADDDILASAGSKGDRLGLSLEELPQRELRALRIRQGLKITSVSDGSPASIAGLVPDDVIVQIGYSGLEGLEEYQDILNSLPEGSPIAIRFYRDGQAYFTTVEIES
jgi:serine protease Do